MSDGWRVTAGDIENWTRTNRRKAQETLPLLVRRLVAFTLNPSHISVPAGDSILIGGWDGILKVDKGNAFVPKGKSAWEFGTDQNIKSKADKDLRKRSQNPKGVTKKTTTFVFATTRTFARRSEWEQSKSKTKWKRVRAINADDIEAWLELAPPVHRWFARLIGKRSAGAWDLEQAWDNWRCATKLPSREELAIGGRQQEADKLCEQLTGRASVIRIHGDSEEEAYAFMLAALIQRASFAHKVLVVHDPKEWDELVESRLPLILIPQFKESRSWGVAIEHGHFVVLPESSKLNTAREDEISLPRANASQQTVALVKMGLVEEVAKDIVRESRGYLTVIRRHRALASLNRQRPSWASPDSAAGIVAALLAGSWHSDNEGDQAQLSRLAGMPYGYFEQLLHKWAMSDDPPVRLVGNTWQLVSRQDAWALLSPFVNASVLDSLDNVVNTVLGELDPRFELPPQERWLAPIREKISDHSLEVRNGLAEILALLGAYGDNDCRNVGGFSVQDRVSSWVYRLLGDNASPDRWKSLADQLPALAEAAPEAFLRSVEQGLRDENPVIISLFENQGDFAGCLHAGLLWSLELLSWNLDLLGLVTRILAKLARLDPGGGRWANRPARTLAEIFLGWLPQTVASLDTRVRTIDGILRTEPEPAWQLLLDLLPQSGGGISNPIYKPKYRDWARSWKSGVTQRDYYAHLEAITERLLQHVDDKPGDRWPDVIKAGPHLPRALFEKILQKLEALRATDFSDEQRKRSTDELRKIISRHRQFPDAQWALPINTVDRLEAIHQRLLPSDPIERHKYLFDNPSPELLRPTDRKQHRKWLETVEQERRAALEEIWQSLADAGLLRLVGQAKFPRGVGIVIPKTRFAKEVENLILGWLDNENSALSACAEAYVLQRATGDPTWANDVRKQFAQTWSSDVWAAFCLGIPFGKAVFDLLQTLGTDVSKIYWKKVRGCYLTEGEGEYAGWVLQQLLDNKRPLAAIDAAAQYLDTSARRRGLSSDLLASVLEQAAVEPEEKDSSQLSSLGDHIPDLIRALQSAGDLPQDRLAKIEWTYISIFRFNEIKPVTLINILLQEPSFFAQIVSLTFKATPVQIETQEQESAPSEVRRQQAQRGWEFLELVDRVPGQLNDSVNEKILTEWVRVARERCSASRRLEVGDRQIGRILAHCPPGTDGIWPHEAIRNLLEFVDSENIERGMRQGRYNQRGMTSRDPGEGGVQERELSNRYEQMALRLRDQWPRTSALLNRLAVYYRQDARHEDQEVDLLD